MFAVGSFGETVFCTNEFGAAFKIQDGKVEGYDELWGSTCLSSGPSGLWSSCRGGTYLYSADGCQTIVEPAASEEDEQ